MGTLIKILAGVAITTVVGLLVTSILEFIEGLNDDFAEGRTREAEEKLEEHMIDEGREVRDIYKNHQHEMSEETKIAYQNKMKEFGY